MSSRADPKEPVPWETHWQLMRRHLSLNQQCFHLERLCEAQLVEVGRLQRKLAAMNERLRGETEVRSVAVRYGIPQAEVRAQFDRWLASTDFSALRMHLKNHPPKE